METETVQPKKNHSWVLVTLGIIQIILGIVALVIPYLVGLAFVWVLGVIFLAAMIFNLYQVFTIPHYRVWNLISALLYGLAGVLFIWNPVAAAMTLTLLIGWLFIVGGIIRLVTAFKPRNGWLIFNGIVTLLLGLLIVIWWPAATAWVLGTFVAIDLIFSGWAMLTMGTAVNRLFKTR